MSQETHFFEDKSLPFKSISITASLSPHLQSPVFESISPGHAIQEVPIELGAVPFIKINLNVF